MTWTSVRPIKKESEACCGFALQLFSPNIESDIRTPCVGRYNEAMTAFAANKIHNGRFDTMIQLIVAILLLALNTNVAAQTDSLSRGQGMASTAHPLATKAAETIFNLGGNSVDAAIAVSLTLSVVEPSMSGLGGRAQAIVRLPDGSFRGYNGMTEIPADFVLHREMPSSGYTTVATPGLIALLQALHENHGSLPFEDLIKPAIERARQGFVMLPGGASRFQSSVGKIRQDPGLSRVYLNDEGNVAKAGEALKQPALARTLTRLGQFGPRDFYQGEIARQISADVLKNGGFITLADLKTYAVLPGRYIKFPYRDYEIHTLAAPAGGGLVAKALMLLSQFEVSNLSERSWALLLAQALALSIESMAGDYYEFDLIGLTEPAWAKQNLSRIRLPVLFDGISDLVVHNTQMESSTDWLAADSGHTSHFVTADCSGLTLSMTQTLGPLFGAKVATPALGFPYAATMGGYLRTGRQDPGSRPRTAIAPVIVTKNDQVVLVLGAAGGIKIPSAIVQVLSRYIDQGRSLEAALALPRVHPASTIDKENNRQVSLEHFQAETTSGGWMPGDVASWRKAGFNVTEIDSKASFARIHALESKAGVLIGSADPDWEGSSLRELNCIADAL